MKKLDRLTKDMGDHFTDLLHTLIVDTADTCEHGGMDAADTMSILVSVLMTETVRGAIAMQLSEDDYADFARAAHQRCRRLMAAEKRR
jgi:hypothetical protein